MHHELDEGARKNPVLGAGTAPTPGHGTPRNDAPDGDIQTSGATRNSDGNWDNLRDTESPFTNPQQHRRHLKPTFTGTLFWLTMGSIFTVLTWAEFHQEEFRKQLKPTVLLHTPWGQLAILTPWGNDQTNPPPAINTATKLQPALKIETYGTAETQYPVNATSATQKTNQQLYKCKLPNGSTSYQSMDCPIDATSRTVIPYENAKTGTITLHSDYQGNFFTAVKINGIEITGMIDTGAATLVIPTRQARLMGIATQGARIQLMQTANGITEGLATTLPSITIGDHTLHNVETIIAPNVASALIGMSALRNFKVTTENREMTLSSR